MQTLKIDPLYLKTTLLEQRTGPDRAIVAHLGTLGIPGHRDVFRFYHSDVGAAQRAGHDVRTTLLCFGADVSHGHGRTRLSVLVHLAQSLTSPIRAGSCSETPLPDAGEPVHRSRAAAAS